MTTSDGDLGAGGHQGRRPLDGIRVCDLTTVVMGPLATRMLADMGADVIRVESYEGDVIREYEPMRSPKMGAFAMSLNRNKRSICLDLKSPTGAQAMRDLVATSDVFVTNMRRGALGRLQLDETSIRSVRPDIIYCVANGFGSDGPRAEDAAYDDVIQAASGLAGMFTWSGGDPQLLPSIYADKVAGAHIAFAVASALAGRERDGQGCSIEVPMAETLASFNLVEHLGGLTFEPPIGEFSYTRIRNRNRRPRRTSDGWVVLMPYSTDNWHRFWEFGGLSHLKHDPRFATMADRVAYAEELYATIDEVCPTRSTAAWLEFCAANSIAAAEVLDLEQVRSDEHFRSVELLKEAVHPTEGPYRYVRDPIKINERHTPLFRHAPRLGADTAEVLTELGYSPDRISSITAKAADPLGPA